MDRTSELIRMEHIHKAFSGVSVIKDVGLVLEEGEILGLVGENGAGKSTLMNLLTGVIPFDSGEIRYKGKLWKPRNALESQLAGISFIHQELDLFENLNVMENMFIENLPKRLGFFTDKKAMHDRAQQVIERIGGGLVLNTLVRDMEMGKRQMLEIAKAISRNASVIIFDEPTTSLTAAEKEKLFLVIGDLKAEGRSIIYISHNLDEIFRLCDRIMVMRDGRHVDTLVNKGVSRETLVHLMVGRPVDSIFPYTPRKNSGVAMELRNIRKEPVVRGISLQIHHGETLGLFGLMGAGRSELLRCVWGVESMDSGEVIVEGESLKSPNPMRCIGRNMAFLTENRGHEGLLLDKSVEENLALTNLKALSKRFGMIDFVRQHSLTEKMVDKLGIKTYDQRTQTARKLSGGNQQKIVVGKWLLTKPSIFMLDEPTRGIDVGAKAEIYELINQLALSGNAILVVSSEMEELMGICDRIIVINKGEISGELKRAEFNQERLLQLAFGVRRSEQ